MPIKSTIEPIPYQRVLHESSRVPSRTLFSEVDLVVHRVNGQLMDPTARKKARCSPQVGNFWQVSGDNCLTAQDVRRLHRKFKAAGWPAVKVTTWQGRWNVTLSESNRVNFGPSCFEGNPLYPVRNPVVK